MILQSGGGGGFGDPLARDPVLVERDVRYGYVTPEGASRDYGVAITPEGHLDPFETERLRAEIRQNSN